MYELYIRTSHKEEYLTQFDHIYNTLVNDVLTKGTDITENVRTVYSDGTPAYYRSLIGYQFRYDNSTDIPPVLTTRYSPYKSAIRETYWMWFLRSNNVNVLQSLGCKYWNEWALSDGTIGKSYGWELSQPIYNFNNQLDYIIHELKHNPNSRRIITEMWVPKDLHEMALVPCLHLTQWSVLNGKLYLELRQRSADVALGVVSNLLQYSILHKLVAHECGLEPAEIIYTIHNAHIYDRHIPIIQEQINSTPVDCNPILKINYPKSIQDFKPEDIVIENYSIHDLPQYKYDIAI